MNKTKYNWKEVQKDYDENLLTIKDLNKKYGMSTGTIVKAKNRGDFKSRTPSEAQKIFRKKNPDRCKLSQETKDKISKSMKKFMKDNPDKIPYLQNHYSKGESYPEKYFRECFNGRFQEKFRILNYQLDFADVENKIDIEIDGEQHFVDPRIKESDERRNKSLTELGWSIIRIRWSVFSKMSKKDKQNLVKSILNNEDMGYECCLFISDKPDKDKIKLFYETHHVIKTKTKTGYEYQSVKKKPCPDCGKRILLKSKLCHCCNQKNNRKTKWPTKEYLEKEVWKKPATDIGKDFGVSDKTVEKWCKIYRIEKPSLGYWNRIRSGENHESAIKPKIHSPKNQKFTSKRFSDDEIRKIRNMLETMSVYRIAKIYSVNKHTIYDIKNGKTYKGIGEHDRV